MQPRFIEPLEQRTHLATTPITVMTQNVYYGGGSGIDIFTSAFGDMWDNVQESRIPERAAAIAKQIKRNKPDLVGLQEVVTWRTGPPFLPFDADDVEFDFLDSIMKKLRRGKARYKVVSSVTNADWEIPGQVGSSLRDIRMTDHDVILARVGRGSRFTVVDSDHGNYKKRFSVPIPAIDDIDFTRGWASVDVQPRGAGQKRQRFRFINTHLEVFDIGVQQRQARQFLRGPAKTNLPVIIAGDLNTIAGSPTYQMITDRFEDAWAVANPGQSGPTCCQDDDLRNQSSELSTRIDFILFSARRIDVDSVERVNEDPVDKSRSGLWPSDHAGVVARLHFE